MTVYLSEYKTFDNKHELNHHVSGHEKAHFDVMNATHRNIFRFIARYSVKYAGASHLKVSTIAAECDKSERTIGRVLRFLESLNIIRRVKQTRPKTGGKGASIIQILPYVSECLSDSDIDENACDSSNNSDNFKDEPLSKQNNLQAHIRDGKDEGKRALKTAIPKAIYKKLEPYFNANQLYEVYGVLLRAKSSIDRTVTFEDYSDEYMDEFMNIIRKYKAGEVRSFKGLLYSTWEKVTSEISRRKKAESENTLGMFQAVIKAG